MLCLLLKPEARLITTLKAAHQSPIHQSARPAVDSATTSGAINSTGCRAPPRSRLSREAWPVEWTSRA